ncbi:MAG: alpha-amylase [Verrucomicrobia bacterium]|nr:alpha-amylase [Verrucomicrobiota bacterium]
MTHPLLFEVNARHWIADLSAKQGAPLELGSVPEVELERLQARGFTHLWLMGVWPTGAKSRAQALQHSELRKAYQEALPGWTEADVVGSPYAVEVYRVAPSLGGDAALAALRARLAARGIKLILDFVPNHLGLDHAWVESRDHLFVGKSEPFNDAFPLETPSGKRFLAHGKDPYFAGWTDTVQLDYRRSETRRAMTDLLLSIAQKCDGVRCDMAMLLLSEVFEKTWHHVPPGVESASGEFWQDAIAEVKSAHPEFVFLAEAYWGLEGRLCDLGFDFAYDKTLYDRLLHHHLGEVQAHLLGLGAGNWRRAHFLENHDEPRLAGIASLDLQRAAAALCLGLPGMRFFHEGQFEGVRRFARVQLARRAVEPVDFDVESMYAALFAAFSGTSVGRGQCQILEPYRAWDDNPTAQFFCITQWQEPGVEDRFDLVVVNLAWHQAQCRVRLTAQGGSEGVWRLADRLGTERWERDGSEMVRQGLFLDLPAMSARLFSFQREKAFEGV